MRDSWEALGGGLLRSGNFGENSLKDVGDRCGFLREVLTVLEWYDSTFRKNSADISDKKKCKTSKTVFGEEWRVSQKELWESSQGQSSEGYLDGRCGVSSTGD